MGRWRKRPTETPYERMDRAFRKKREYLTRIRLPEASDYVRSHPDIGDWIREQRAKFDAAFEEAHEPAFDRGLSSYADGWVRVNQLIAEIDTDEVTARVVKLNPGMSPEDVVREVFLTQRLAYIRWRRELVSFTMETTVGEVVVYRVEPRRTNDERWTTIDRFLDMHASGAALMLEAFGTFPVNPDFRFERLAKGENSLHVDLTKGTLEMWTEFGK